MIYKISITGPESTGKSELAEHLAKEFETLWVPEYSREYLAGINRPYNEGDILEIAKGQVKKEDEMMHKANKFLLCDTDILVNYIWSLDKYGHCDPWIGEQLEKRKYDLYLLCNTDLPWEEDPLRENPHDRDELFALYELKLKMLDFPYRVISGTGDERYTNAIKAIKEYVN